MKLTQRAVRALAATIGVIGIGAGGGTRTQRGHAKTVEQSALIQKADVQAQAAGVNSGEKPNLPFAVEVRNLVGTAGPVTVDVIPGSESGIDVIQDHVTPSKACLRGAAASSCFETVADRNFGQPATAEALDLGDGHSGLMLTATINGVTGSMRMVAILGLDASGRLVNLAPFVYVGDEDMFRYWHGAGKRVYGTLTVANTIWDMDHETRFADHRYQISSYAYCPMSKRFVPVDQFKTRRKYPMETDGNPGVLVLKDMMPLVKARLARKHGASRQRKSI